MTATPPVVVYRPELAPIDAFVIGRAGGRSRVETSRSPSLHQLDLAMDVKETRDPTTGADRPPFTLAYASGAYLSFTLDELYLFAFAAGPCVGSLSVSGDDVVLPDGQRRNLVDYVTAHLGGPFPDYFGFVEPIVAG